MSDFSLLQPLTRRFDKVVRDPIWGDIHMDESLLALSKSREFQLLDHIRQLGPVAQLYPGATHTRRAHSLGVYFIARRFALSLVERGQIPFVTRKGLRSFLVSALLHDIGHFPYAHSLKELLLSHHETLAGELVLADPLEGMIRDCQADPELVSLIIDKDKSGGDDRETTLFRRLLSGVLDPDKIDYLTRDAFYCGVPYGIQDADYIVRRVLVEGDRLAVDERGEMSIEAVLVSKYQMYRAVYWHPTVRSATAMVRKSVYAGLESGQLAAHELYGLGDEAFARLIADRSEWTGLAGMALNGELYSAVCEIPYNSKNLVHMDLENLGRRLEAETTLAMAAGLASDDIVIDIPEPIHFETDLAVRRGSSFEDFSRHTALFGSSRLEELVNSLRMIRIFVHPRVEAATIAGFARELLA